MCQIYIDNFNVNIGKITQLNTQYLFHVVSSGNFPERNSSFYDNDNKDMDREDFSMRKCLYIHTK